MNADRKTFGLRTVAASAALSTALLFATASFAADATSGQNPPAGQSQEQPAATPNAPPAAAADSSAPKTAKAKKRMTRAERVEARINSLHSKLHITAAEETQWDTVAQIMRDNATAVGKLVDERKTQVGQMNAVDDLKSYQAITDAHADGLKKLVPAFEQLYASMSDDQKKTADTLFRHTRRPHTPRKG
jgi:hypothetical protein